MALCHILLTGSGRENSNDPNRNLGMTTDVIEIKDRDIFHWRYRDEKRHSDYLSYWAKSRICVARDGKLLDTFSDYSPTIASSCEEAAEKLVLTYVANFCELENQREYMKDYYDDADCVNLNHSNSSRGNFYIRKDAKRSEQKMREAIAYKIEQEESAIRVATLHIESLRKELAKIDSGELLEKVYL
jgi:hypothetical protein